MRTKKQTEDDELHRIAHMLTMIVTIIRWEDLLGVYDHTMPPPTPPQEERYNWKLSIIERQTARRKRTEKQEAKRMNALIARINQKAEAAKAEIDALPDYHIPRMNEHRHFVCEVCGHRVCQIVQVGVSVCKKCRELEAKM